MEFHFPLVESRGPEHAFLLVQSDISGLIYLETPLISSTKFHYWKSILCSLEPEIPLETHSLKSEPALGVYYQLLVAIATFLYSAIWSGLSLIWS